VSHSRPSSPAASHLRAVGALVLGTIAAGTLAACSNGDTPAVRAASAAERAPRQAPPTDVTLPGIAPVAGGYKARAVTDGGTVTGVVSLAGTAPGDTTVRPDAALLRPCGASLVDRTVHTRGAFVEDAVVWLADVKGGKPVSGTRRHELTMDRCQLSPRALAVASGGTLNVHGRDPLSLRLRATAWPAGEVRATWRLTDAGQVVPDDRVLTDAGTLEVRGESLPWVRAWVLVFDHPYFAATADAGRFTLDSVPPGRYTLVAWHPRLGRVQQPIEVATGASATAELKLGK
jgi:hypothetical protein